LSTIDLSQPQMTALSSVYGDLLSGLKGAWKIVKCGMHNCN